MSAGNGPLARGFGVLRADSGHPVSTTGYHPSPARIAGGCSAHLQARRIGSGRPVSTRNEPVDQKEALVTTSTPMGMMDSVRRRRRRRLVGAVAAGAITTVDLVGAFIPRTVVEEGQIERIVGLSTSANARVLLALLGGVSLLLVRGVRLGQRRAWALVVAIGVVSALAQIFRDGTALSAAVCLVATAYLLVDQSAYRIPGRSFSPRWLVLPGVVAVLILAGIGLFEHADGLPDMTAAQTAGVVFRGLLFLPQQITAETAAADEFLDSLRPIGAILILSLAAALVSASRPSKTDLRMSDDDAKFFAAHGRSSSAPLASLPGNHVLRLSDSVRVGGRLAAGAYVAIGSPAAVDGDDEAAISLFVERCDHWGVVPAIVDADEVAANAATGIGFQSLKIGEEAFIDLAGFSLAGKARANVRHSATRAERDGLTVIHYAASDRTQAIDDDLRAINDAWLATKHGPELGFTLGRLDLDVLDRCEMYLALDANGSAVAFTTWMPYAGGSCAVLDLMRRGSTAPPGVMELLISKGLAGLEERGYTTASLGGVPLASTTEREGRLQQVMEWMYDNAGSVYEAKGLFAFKRKFAPRWEPMFLLYPSGADLARVAAAIGRAFLPSAPSIRRRPKTADQ